MLEPRVMQVLVALARSAGEVVSRDTLNSICWGGQVVGDDALSRCIYRLRQLADAFGGFEIETVPRVGYRLGGACTAPGSSAPAATAKPSIAVLPFANLSDAPGQDYFADGMVEEISAALTRFHSLFVVAGGSSLSLKGQGLTPQEAGSRLGVRYLLDGAVRRAGDRVRISVNLIDVQDGVQLWADRFDGDLGDIFSLQDEVALRVAARIQPQVLAEETRRARAKPAADLDAYDLFLRARAAARGDARAGLREAQPLFEQCLALDPNNASALAACALGHSLAVASGWSDNEDAERGLARERIRAALRLAPNDAEVLAFATTVILNLREDLALAQTLVDQALAANPGYAHAWRASGWLKAFTDPDLAVEHLERCLKLDPLSPSRAGTLMGLGLARFGQRRLEEAIALFRQSSQLDADYPANHAFLATCYALERRWPEARVAADRYRATSGRSVVQWAESVGIGERVRSQLTLIPDA